MESINEQFVTRLTDSYGRPTGFVKIDWESQKKWDVANLDNKRTFSVSRDGDICRHCKVLDHKVKCLCGHDHTNHLYGGGCTIKDCACDRYDASRKYTAPVIEPSNNTELSIASVNLEQLELQTQAPTSELVEARKRVDRLKELRRVYGGTPKTQEPKEGQCPVAGEV